MLKVWGMALQQQDFGSFHRATKLLPSCKVTTSHKSEGASAKWAWIIGRRTKNIVDRTALKKGFNNHSMVSTTGASIGEGEVYNSKEAVDSPPVTNISSEIQTSRLLRYKL